MSVNYGTPHQIGYGAVATVRRQVPDTRRTIGPYLMIMISATESEDGYVASPAKSHSFSGRDEILSLRAACDDALTQE